MITFASLKPVNGLIGPLDLTTEEYREYVQPDGFTYRIDSPVALYRRDGGATHRVVDAAGVVHCVPCGALHPNTVIRWKNREEEHPVSW